MKDKILEILETSDLSDTQKLMGIGQVTRLFEENEKVTALRQLISDKLYRTERLNDIEVDRPEYVVYSVISTGRLNADTKALVEKYPIRIAMKSGDDAVYPASTAFKTVSEGLVYAIAELNNTSEFYEGAKKILIHENKTYKTLA